MTQFVYQARKDALVTRPVSIKEREAERLDIEEKYSSLQEEASGKTRKLKKVWTMLTGAKGELADLQAEQQREMEGLLDNVRQLTRDLRLQMLVIDAFIPPGLSILHFILKDYLIEVVQKAFW